MNTKQHNKLAMYQAVQGVLDANNSVWQPLQAFADGYTDFSNHVQNIRLLGQSRMTGTNGIALDKKQSKLAMGTAALEIASAVHAFAVKNKNNTLANETDFTLTDLTAERDADAVKDCQNIHDLANTNLPTLGNYGVNMPKLIALQVAIDAFNGIASKPRDTIASGKTATQQLSDEFDAADKALNDGLDRLIGQFQSANAKFVSDYNNARIIVDTSASHTIAQPPAPQAKPQPQVQA